MLVLGGLRVPPLLACYRPVLDFWEFEVGSIVVVAVCFCPLAACVPP